MDTNKNEFTRIEFGHDELMRMDTNFLYASPNRVVRIFYV